MWHVIHFLFSIPCSELQLFTGKPSELCDGRGVGKARKCQPDSGTGLYGQHHPAHWRRDRYNTRVRMGVCLCAAVATIQVFRKTHCWSFTSNSRTCASKDMNEDISWCAVCNDVRRTDVAHVCLCSQWSADLWCWWAATASSHVQKSSQNPLQQSRPFPMWLTSAGECNKNSDCVSSLVYLKSLGRLSRSALP